MRCATLFLLLALPACDERPTAPSTARHARQSSPRYEIIGHHVSAATGTVALEIRGRDGSHFEWVTHVDGDRASFTVDAHDTPAYRVEASTVGDIVTVRYGSEGGMVIAREDLVTHHLIALEDPRGRRLEDPTLKDMYRLVPATPAAALMADVVTHPAELERTLQRYAPLGHGRILTNVLCGSAALATAATIASGGAGAPLSASLSALCGVMLLLDAAVEAADGWAGDDPDPWDDPLDPPIDTDIPRHG